MSVLGECEYEDRCLDCGWLKRTPGRRPPCEPSTEQAIIDPAHGHATIGEAGQCLSCRERTIASVRETYGTSDLFRHYLLRFTDAEPYSDGPSRSLGMAIVPGPDMSTAVDNAWACGCNPGGHVVVQALPHDLVTRAGLVAKTCALLEGEEAEQAMDALRVATYRLD